MSLKAVIENNTTPTGKLFDLTIQALIVLSLITFSLQTLPNIGQTTRTWLNAIELGTVVIFTIEYLLRLLVADSKPRFVFSFFGLIDLAAILPFYISTGIDLRAIRVFRLLRVFRAFKMLRYSRAVRRFGMAFSAIRTELILFLGATAVVLFVCATGIYYFENSAQPEQFASIFHSLWWAIATLTTVGYGDVYPVTVGGKMFTTVMLFVGMGVVAVPTGLLSSALTKTLDAERDALRPERDGDKSEFAEARIMGRETEAP